MNELGLYALPKLLLRYLKKKDLIRTVHGCKARREIILGSVLAREKMMTYSSSRNATP